MDKTVDSLTFPAFCYLDGQTNIREIFLEFWKYLVKTWTHSSDTYSNFTVSLNANITRGETQCCYKKTT